MIECVFFYGTLMTGFDRRRRAGIEGKLSYIGRGSIHGALFDLGIYPAAVPAADGQVWGEVYQMTDPASVLSALDDIEGHTADDPEHSLYVRRPATVTLDHGMPVDAWVYFYNAPLGQAQRISSGDYLDHVRVR
ncbi:MAG: gamma-glutamylcyclotransferase family protein [Vicinamibacterales bacterium]